MAWNLVCAIYLKVNFSVELLYCYYTFALEIEYFPFLPDREGRGEQVVPNLGPKCCSNNRDVDVISI